MTLLPGYTLNGIHCGVKIEIFNVSSMRDIGVPEEVAS